MKRVVFLLLLAVACVPVDKPIVDLADYDCPDCNVILISIDTFRGDHLTCAGYDAYDVDITENICDFASDGILFNRTMAQSSSTTTSHASILTSSIPSNHGAIYFKRKAISPSKVTIAEVLKDKGYQTAGFVGGSRVNPEFGFDRGFDVYKSLPKRPKQLKFSEIASHGLSWLNKTNERFFLFLHTYEIHAPFTPDIELADLLDADYNGSLPNNIHYPLIRKINNGEISISKEDLRHIIALYDAEIMSADIGFGDFIEELKSMGLYDNTIVVLTSDHGEQFNEHGIITKHGLSLYNEVLHIPLIVRAPGLKSSVETHLVTSLDIAPTLLHMLGIDSPDSFEGRPLFVPDEVPIISEADSDTTAPFAVQTSEWKYYFDVKGYEWKEYYSQKGKDQNIAEFIFNMKQDAQERQNVIEQNPHIKIEYGRIYYDSLINVSDSDSVVLSEETKENLRSLGYLT